MSSLVIVVEMGKEYNRRKLEVLRVIRECGEVSARGLSVMVNTSVNNAQALCYHYRKNGLLKISYKTANNEYFYELTLRGKERLKYLSTTLEKERKPYGEMLEELEEKYEKLKE